MAPLSSYWKNDYTAVLAQLASHPALGDPVFRRRLEEHFPTLHSLFREIYSERPDGRESLVAVIRVAGEGWSNRPDDLRALDARREKEADWFASEKMVGGVCYVDRFAGTFRGVGEQIPYFKELGLTYLHLMPLFAVPEGNNDGGYAVSSYRHTRPELGSMADLRELCTELRRAGISPVVDFIFNHTSSDHDWARKATAGEGDYESFYWIFPDRELPDQYDATTREIFPDDHEGSFVQLPDGRWIWSTFYHFQWDLNYSNPRVFESMAGEMLFLANQGVEVLRMDAVAFIWKQMGTTCESLPQAHLLLQAFNAVLRISAPALIFKSEAIVHPDEVIQYISPGECQISYNPLQMALTWEALATRNVRLLEQALLRRHALPPGTAWVNYVRSHDDIGWTFADEDAAEFGINGYDHRRFLNDFYVGRFPGSFARGVPFQENPKTGDARVAGTAASLAGVESNAPGGEERLILAYALAMSTGGIPLIYLGDEVAMLNDYYYRDDPAHEGDSRWVNRPIRPAVAYAARHEDGTVSERVFAAMRDLLEARKRTREFAGNALLAFHTHDDHVLGFQRPGGQGSVLVLANFWDSPSHVSAKTLSGLTSIARDVVTGGDVDLEDGLTLPPWGFRWLKVTPHPAPVAA